jgi:acyl-CoA thioesterase I
MTPFLQPDDRILFQGDSITDCGRNKQEDGNGPAVAGRDLGAGYAMIVAAHLAADQPSANYTFRNLGISGNRIVDLAARAHEHIWNLQPTVLSILLGVNDTWHAFKRQAGVDVPRYARTYRHLLDDTRQRLPSVRLVLCEPFVLPCGEVGAGWREEIDQRRQVVADLAADFQAVLVPFQTVFDAACQHAPAAHWAHDGVHPTPAGHLLMARAWLQAVGA